jgi:hypothetical protein
VTISLRRSWSLPPRHHPLLLVLFVALLMRMLQA